VITPTQNSQQPTRRSSRLFGSTQSVKENSKALGKSSRISSSVKSPSRKSKPHLVLQRVAEQLPLSENEKNEKNRFLISGENKLNRDKVGIKIVFWEGPLYIAWVCR
jgi:hypothetical protein